MDSSQPVVSRLHRKILHCAVSLAAMCALRLSAVPAFPGAEGFGANATGGRGGSVYVVTNLSDNGPGSFRDAVSQPNRYVVFAVGGVIKISSRIVVKNNITIAGQTAPGEGITIYGNGLSYTSADNTITRYIRIRMGVGGDNGKDAVAIARGHDMIFDHVTVAWGRDETFSISTESGYPDPSNITIQDSMIAMGLQTHSAGGLIQTDGGVSILRCLYIDNHTRNPKVKGVSEFTNNIVYNWGGGGAYILGDSAGQSYTNIVGNYFIQGPNSSAAPFTRGNLNFHVYAADNFHDSNRNGVLDGSVIPASEYTTVDFQSQRYPYPAVGKLLTPAEVYAHVAANAGASKSRDRVDRRYIEELTSLGTLGQIPTNENDAPINGAGPVLGGTASVDTDQDGMPDAWEQATGTNPAVQDHNGDLNGDGYTNLEEYINSLAPAAVQGVAFTGITTDTGSSGADAVTSDTTITLNGTAEAGSTVTITRIGTGVIGTAVAGAGGAWSFDYSGTSLPDGAHPFTAVAVTPGGWTTPPTPAFIVTVDNTAPAAPQIASTTLSSGNLVFNGSAEPGATIVVSRDGTVVGTAIANNTGLWSASYTGAALAPGVYSFTSAASDRAGNSGAASSAYTIDTSLVPPAFTSIATDTGALANDLITSDTTLQLNGTGPVGATVSVTRAGVGVIGTATVAPGGTWTFNYTGTTLSAGAHIFSATASNGGVSSTSSAPFTVTIDSTAPVVSTVERLNPITAANVASTLVWRVTFSEAVSGVDASDFTLTASGASGTVASVSASSGTVFDVTVNGVTGDGTLRLDLKSTGTGIADVAGNAIATGFTTAQVYTVRLAGSGVWISTESGDLWSDEFSWAGGTVGSGAGATADFSTFDVEQNLTVQLDSARTLGRLIFGDTDTSSAASWTIESPGNQLTLTAASGAPSLVVNTLGTGATANLAVGLTSTTGLTKTGSGTAVLAGPSSVEGIVTIGGGALRVGDGGSVALGNVTITAKGAQLQVAGTGSLTVNEPVYVREPGSKSGVYVSGGTAAFNAGISFYNARDGRVQITGGTFSATSIDFPRSNDDSKSYTNGMFVQGGVATVGVLSLSTANSYATLSVEAGTLNVTGPVSVGWNTSTANRGGLMRVTGGTFNSTDTELGLILSRRSPGDPGTTQGTATFSGGVSNVERIQLGSESTTGGPAKLEVTGGTLYVGSGGITRFGSSAFISTISLTSGKLGARGDWSTTHPIALGGGFTIAAADAANTPHTITLSGAVSGTGPLTKTGAGTLTLAGANSFTGATDVNEGKLRITGSLTAAESTITVNSGGTLAGNTALNRPVVLNSGGAIAPDSTTAYGTISMPTLTWNGGGSLGVSLGANGTSDQVAVIGALTKGSAGTFNIAFSAGEGFAVGNTYTIATFESTDLTLNDITASGLPAGTGALFTLNGTSLQVSIQGLPVFTSASEASSVIGAPFSFTATTTQTPVTFSATGLPLGLSITPSGIISGNAMASGTFTANVSATNTAGTTTRPLTLTVTKVSTGARIALSALTAVYDGNPHPVTAVSVPAGYPMTVTYNGSTTPPTLPGTYAVVATIDHAVYHATATGTLVISRASQKIKYQSTSQEVRPNDSVVLGLTTDSGLPVTYTVVSGPGVLDGNKLTFTGTGTVTVRVSQGGGGNYDPAADVILTFYVTSLKQVYFGKIGTDDFAAVVDLSTRKGTLISRLSSTGEALIATFTLQPDGTFSSPCRRIIPTAEGGEDPARQAAVADLTFAGSVRNGTLSASIAELGATFAAEAEQPTGATATYSGLYTAPVLGTAAGATYIIAGSNGTAYALVVNSNQVAAGTGTVSADGSISVAGSGSSTVSGSVDASTSSLTGTVTIGTTTSNFAGLASTAAHTDRLVNLSSRLRVTGGDGARTVVAGFVVTGSEPKQYLIRAVGPTLSGYGIASTLSNPQLRLYNAANEVIASNAGWNNDTAISAATTAAGAFKLTAGSADAALLVTLSAGSYTAHVGSNNSGIVLVEVYDLAANAAVPTKQLLNISTRGHAGTGDDVVVAGFVVAGNEPKRVLIRGIGPGLAGYGVTGTVTDPVLTIRDAAQTVIAKNDNWGTPQPVDAKQTAATGADIMNANTATGAFPLASGSKDAAVVVTLTPGAYTAILAGANNETGIAMVEVYELE